MLLAGVVDLHMASNSFAIYSAKVATTIDIFTLAPAAVHPLFEQLLFFRRHILPLAKHLLPAAPPAMPALKAAEQYPAQHQDTRRLPESYCAHMHYSR